MNEPVVIVCVQDLGNVALKIVGLFLICYGVLFFPGPLFFTSLQEGAVLKMLGAIIHGGIIIALGACLARWSAKLSKILFESAAVEGLPLPLATELQTVAFRIMGIYVLSNGLPGLVQTIILSEGETIGLGDALVFWGTQVAFGLALFLYKSGWPLRLWKRRHSPSGRNDSGT